MATITPIAYNNTGNPIPGTTQIGDLAIGDTSQDYGAFPSGFRFWATPDEDLYYVIAYPVPAGNHPNPLSIPCYVGFFKTQTKTLADFLGLANYIANQDNDPQNFTNGQTAVTWLNNNGYWTSYVSPLLVSLDSGNPSSYSGAGNTWFDLSGYGNNATLVNTPTYSSSYGGIIQFDNASLETANIPNLGNLQNWTIEAWVRFTSVPISSNPNATAIITNQYNGSTALNFSMGTNNAPGNYNVSIGFYDGSWHNTTGFVPQANVWYQIVGTYDGTTLRQYVNGNASGGTLNYVGVPQSGGQTRLMRRWDSTPIQGDYCDGDLAIVNIYSEALTGADVLSSYNSNFSRFIEPSPTPTPTPTITPTVTPTNTVTPTVTPSVTPSITPSITASVTPSVTPSISPSPSVTPSVTPSITPTRTLTPTPSITPTITKTPTVTPTITPTPSSTPPSPLTVHFDISNSSSYPGSGNQITDLSGNGNTGTLNGDYSYSALNSGTISMGGTNSYVNVPQSASINISNTSTPVSVVMWINITAGYANGDGIWNKNFDAGSYDGYRLIAQSNNQVRLGINGSSFDYNISSASNAISTGTWMMITTIVQGGTSYIYRDNNSTPIAQGATTAQSIPSNTANLQLCVGEFNTLGGYLPCRWGQFRYYKNKSLSTTEIANLFNADKAKYGL